MEEKLKQFENKTNVTVRLEGDKFTLTVEDGPTLTISKVTEENIRVD